MARAGARARSATKAARIGARARSIPIGIGVLPGVRVIFFIGLGAALGMVLTFVEAAVDRLPIFPFLLNVPQEVVDVRQLQDQGAVRPTLAGALPIAGE